MKRIANTDVTDEQIRNLYNASRDGTATDALIRYRCQVALYERVVADETHPCGVRYPDCAEHAAARRLCAVTIARRQS